MRTVIRALLLTKVCDAESFSKLAGEKGGISNAVKLLRFF
jgi:hypothetical protein